MEKEKPRLARLTAILTQLQSASLTTASELANKHGVSVRTIYRDVRTLEKSGIPIVTEEGRGYSIMEGYKLPPVMFTEEEANALITAELIISQNKDESLSNSYSAAIEKIKSVLRNSERKKSEILTNKLEIRNNWKNEKSSTYLIEIQKALTHYQVINLEYSSAEDSITSRKIEPFALVHSQDNWVLIAFCRLRSDFRAFRLDRMRYMALQRKTFTPHKMTLEQYYKKYFPAPKNP
ncbi:MAG: helix-turn-helix transcriptional regulator [Flavobacteriales bacterium]